ncbi:hypothetical protein AAH991_29895 [Microbispora sp. ZYX-F-249]|uniref:DUF4760 domain-containing protein n=1 Tax=Microbispora maris TaxID=3144104 RepID=A0ABV0AZ35_9ACTN
MTGTASPVPAAPGAQLSPASNSVTAAVLSAAVIAAIISATVAACTAVWTTRRKSREEERARQRDLFARAYQAYAAYKEMPYAIRRRRHDDAAAERIRLSETTREIQSQLSYFAVWTAAESGAVGDAYAALVRELRKVAGGAMREAWLAEPIIDDAAMNIPPAVIDLSSLTPLEEAFTDAVRAHLAAIAPWWTK